MRRLPTLKWGKLPSFMIGLGAILCTACSFAAPKERPPSEIGEVQFPAIWLKQIVFAYNDFKETKFKGRNQNPSCFVVELFHKKGKYYVAISPKSNMRVDGDNIKMTLGGSNECGYGIVYEFDSDRNFKRKIFQR